MADELDEGAAPTGAEQAGPADAGTTGAGAAGSGGAGGSKARFGFGRVGKGRKTSQVSRPDAPKAASGGSGGPRKLLPVAIVLLVVLVGALVVGIWFGIKAVQGFSEARGVDNAVSAAEQVAEDFTTFDVATGDKDTERLLSGTTKRYAAGFNGDKEAFLKQLIASQAKSKGTVLASGVVDSDPLTDTVSVLVTVRAEVSTKDAPSGPPRTYRMEITMKDESRLPGGWKADAVEFRG